MLRSDTSMLAFAFHRRHYCMKDHLLRYYINAVIQKNTFHILFIDSVYSIIQLSLLHITAKWASRAWSSLPRKQIAILFLMLVVCHQGHNWSRFFQVAIIKMVNKHMYMAYCIVWLRVGNLVDYLLEQNVQIKLYQRELYWIPVEGSERNRKYWNELYVNLL